MIKDQVYDNLSEYSIPLVVEKFGHNLERNVLGSF